jgi:adenylate cyclase
LSKEIVDILIAHPATAKLGGDERSVTILASDIADFSTISEPLPPEKLVLFLQEYREEMTAIVLKHGGTLDTFRGDMMLAFWGAPIAHEDHARRACVAAMEIQARLEQVRPRWQRTGKPAVDVRIGIDTGDVVIGNMGGRARFDYSVIGETVNFARRLETANKDYRSQIILSDSTYGHVRDTVIARELDLLLMKGRTEPVKIWELLTTIDAPLHALRQQALDSYHLGLQQFRERQWNDAIRSLQEAKALDPTCFAADVYEQRALYYKLNPPGPDWNGVFTRNTP